MDTERLMTQRIPRRSYACALALAVLTSCGRPDLQSENARLKSELARSTETAKTERETRKAMETSVAEVTHELANASDVLQQLESEQAAIAHEIGRLRVSEVPTAPQSISQRIAALRDSVHQREEALRKLLEVVKSQGDKLAGFERLIATYQGQLEAKDRAIADFDRQVATLSKKVLELEAKTEEQQATITEKERQVEETAAALTASENERHRRFFLVASKAHLLESGIIQKRGGFIGIGRVLTLKIAQATPEFTEADDRQFESVAIPAAPDEIRVVSNHAADSFRIAPEGKTSKLIVSNRERFWESTTLLVVAFDD